jgi:hypothetical protein
VRQTGRQTEGKTRRRGPENNIESKQENYTKKKGSKKERQGERQAGTKKEWAEMKNKEN